MHASHPFISLVFQVNKQQGRKLTFNSKSSELVPWLTGNGIRPSVKESALNITSELAELSIVGPKNKYTHEDIWEVRTNCQYIA